MAFNEELIEDIKRLGIPISDQDIAEFERQNVNTDEDIDIGEDTSMSATTARVHVAAMGDPVLQDYIRRSLQFEKLPIEEQNEISAVIYIASIKNIPPDKYVKYVQLKMLYKKRYFKSWRYIFNSQKAKAHAATVFMVGSFVLMNKDSTQN